MDAAGTVSVLHVLEHRSIRSFDRVLSRLSRECGTPMVSLASFDFQFAVCSLVPLPFAIRRGAFAFETVGRDLLVAVMNPRDRALRRDAEVVTERACHFFLTLPAEFDEAIKRYRETLEHGKLQE
jgi:hypothetical protein